MSDNFMANLSGYNQVLQSITPSAHSKNSMMQIVPEGIQQQLSSAVGSLKVMSGMQSNQQGSLLNHDKRLGALEQSLSDLKEEIANRIDSLESIHIKDLQDKVSKLEQEISQLKASSQSQENLIQDLTKKVQSSHYFFSSLGWKVISCVPKMLFNYSKKYSEKCSETSLLSKAAISYGISYGADNLQKRFKKPSFTLKRISQLSKLAAGSSLFLLSLKALETDMVKQSFESVSYNANEASNAVKQLFNSEESSLNASEKKAKILFGLSSLTGCGCLAYRVKNFFEKK